NLTCDSDFIVDTDKFFVDQSTGNVGIGDTTPTYKLDVAGTGRFTGDLTCNGFTCSDLTTTVTGNFGSVQTTGEADSGWEGYSINGRYVFMSNGTSNLAIYNDVDNQWIWQFHRGGEDEDQRFYTSGTERMRIDFSGNVGIGDNNFSGYGLDYKLDVDGTGRFTGNLTCDSDLSVTGTITGTLGTAAQPAITSVGTLIELQVDNININGNTISSTAGTDLKITPLTGERIVLDNTIVIDAGVVTGATSITSTAFVGNLTGNVTGSVLTAAQTAITSVGTLIELQVDNIN
ncbi:uncharacterized protein METZ01_LOCUS392958, partial [marine metagenome]